MTKRTAAELRARDEQIDSIPWVDRLEEPIDFCDGIKWSQVALKHLYEMNGRPAEGIPAKARCKLPAHWRFTAMPEEEIKDKYPGQRATTGKYCIHHLFQQIYDYGPELERYHRWSAEQEPSR